MKIMRCFILCVFLCTNLLIVNSQTYDWVKTTGDFALDLARSVATDHQGSVYTVGYFRQTVDFDPGAGATDTFFLSSVSGTPDIFIQKLDSNGKFLWAKGIGGGTSDDAYAVSCNAAGDVFVTGYYSGAIDFDPGPGVFTMPFNGTRDAFVLKLDGQGNFVWAKNIGGLADNKGLSIHVDASGEILVGGTYEGTIDLDPHSSFTNTQTSNGLADIFLVKLNSSGDHIWGHSLGSTGTEELKSVTTNSTGDVLVVGAFELTMDFDPGVAVSNQTSSGGKDIFIEKFNGSGSYTWVRVIGGPSSDDYLTDITVDTAGNIYTAGHFEGTVDFDPSGNVFNLTSDPSTYNGVVLKLDANGMFLNAVEFGGTSDNFSNSISLDRQSGVFISGNYQGTADFNPDPYSDYNLTSNGAHDIFVLKLNQNTLNFYEVKSFGGSSGDFGLANATDASGNVFTVGYFQSVVDFDPGSGVDNHTAVSNSVDFYVHKMKPCTYLDTAVNAFTNLLEANAFSLTDSIYYQWYDCAGNQLIPIAGETDQVFYPSVSGSYAVEVTRFGCTGTSSCHNFFSVGVQENNGNDQIKIYPNPVKDHLIVDLHELNVRGVANLYDLTGALVKSYPIRQPRTTIPAEELINGVYFLELKDTKNSILTRHKVVINH